MNYKRALKGLEQYLKPEKIIALSMYSNAIPGGIGICLQVADIINQYNSTQENEDRVCELLRIVLKHHFSRKV